MCALWALTESFIIKRLFTLLCQIPSRCGAIQAFLVLAVYESIKLSGYKHEIMPVKRLVILKCVSVGIV